MTNTPWVTLAHFRTPSGNPIETDGTSFRDAVTHAEAPIDTHDRITCKGQTEGWVLHYRVDDLLKRFARHQGLQPSPQPEPEPQADDVLRKTQELADEGRSLRQIGAELGMSKNNVARLGVKTLTARRPRGRPKNLQLLNDVQSLVSFGQTNASEIARQLKAPRSTVQRMMKEGCS